MSDAPETIVKGYKATDANICCRGFQFEVGRWYEVEGDLEMCRNGFHFCPHMSGVWCYYYALDTRVWEIEAQDVLPSPDGPGADIKKVCRRIRLIREIVVTGDSNTGNSNTGYGNTGDSNTGNSNTGNSNTGNSNTGNSNTGYGNTGDSNTGNRNTGYGNTGDSNTGNSNTGNSNTGDRNTGNSNTGSGNATNYSSGFFNSTEQAVVSFDVDTGMVRDEYLNHYPEALGLSIDLLEDDCPEFEKYKNIPGITPEKLVSLHAKHKEMRNAK